MSKTINDYNHARKMPTKQKSAHKSQRNKTIRKTKKDNKEKKRKTKKLHIPKLSR